MKKLTLNRETLTELAEADLANVGGAQQLTPVIFSIPLDGCVQFTWQSGCSWACTI